LTYCIFLHLTYCIFLHLTSCILHLTLLYLIYGNFLHLTYCIFLHLTSCFLHLTYCIFCCRFGTNYIMVKRLLKVKEGVKRMILSDDWKRWLEATRSIRSEATDIMAVIDDPRFWSRMEEICVVLEPAFKMIKLLEADAQTVADVYATAVEV
jgi:hypothetical protein